MHGNGNLVRSHRRALLGQQPGVGETRLGALRRECRDALSTGDDSLTLGRLLQIELKWHKLPAISLICFVAAGVCQGVGSILTVKALVHAPASVWRRSGAHNDHQFFSHQSDAPGEVVTFRDGAAAALVVAGVLGLR